MILNPMQTTVAYRCPMCGACVTSPVGVFSLSGDMYKLKCKCGESLMTITMTSDGKVRLDVPCVICPKPHNYVLSREVFFGRELFTVICSYSAMEICFIGTTEAVNEAFAKATKSLAELIGVDEDDFESAFGEEDDDSLDPEELLYDSDEEADAAIDKLIAKLASANNRAAEDKDADISDDESEDSPPDVFLHGVIHFVLTCLKDEGEIECRCDNADDADYDFEITDSGVLIFCRVCGASKHFDITGTSSAQDFVSCSHIELE